MQEKTYYDGHAKTGKVDHLHTKLNSIQFQID